MKFRKDITSIATLSVNKDNNGGPDANEGSIKLVDNDVNTKFLVSDFPSDFWVQLQFRQKYRDGYRVTARFFIWIEKKYKKNLVKKLNKAMCHKIYQKGFWEKETGKTVDQLWSLYASDPFLGKGLTSISRMR